MRPPPVTCTVADLPEVAAAPPNDPRPPLLPLALLLAAAIVLGTVACPKLPPVTGCVPLSQECVAVEGGTRPAVCSPSQRTYLVGDTTCEAVGAVCVVSNAGVARCMPTAADAGGDR